MPIGWEAEEAVEGARKQVARLISVNAREIVFTSGATESNNLAVKGVVGRLSGEGQPHRHHRDRAQGGLDVCKALEREGVEVDAISRSTAAASLDPEAVRAAIRETTLLVSVMHANNEIGIDPGHRRDRDGSARSAG